MLDLGFRFAQAAIVDDPAADLLRAEIQRRFGVATVTAASFAAATGRVYPVLKRGLGHGATCQKLNLKGEMVDVCPVK